ncbi:hypothetical protein EVA_06136 [gut metagenome]|uniref:Uncharacterized protein n=1 Tax=gut metagenome TaxID=749906 RepID=J9CZM7_9ZZZZ
MSLIILLINSLDTLLRCLANSVKRLIFFLCRTEDASAKQSLTAFSCLLTHSIYHIVKGNFIIQLLPLSLVAGRSKPFTVVSDATLLHNT